MVGLPDVDDMYNRLHTIPVCDGHTDRRTDILPWHSPRYAYASRGKAAHQMEMTLYLEMG